ncbi:alpha-aspartyl dipeptidase [Photinus pyralis]|uniref:dipeptidase E n=1 Tax=Photinus pyralis TaxID=7054 RepID=A0A1Y1L5R1_PHOPY|nr:alpha-aspartyl dipeptidase [Photinus pyralis]XP_031343853.1 alpha-aspartyl dipeptidase [Photinus pyralis]
MLSRRILLLSTSRVHGYEFLEYAKDDINKLLRANNITNLLFIPYALKDHDSYLAKVDGVLSKWGYKVTGIHSGDPKALIREAEAIYVGGGNTFRLLKTLYDYDLIELIRKRVLHEGLIYLGSSAGTNVATRGIHTTNDMPIVYPPSLDALKLVPFNINPHYLDADPNSVHKGETREERILQYQELPEAGVVVGLREGSMLLIENETMTLKGISKSRLFIPGEDPREIDVGADISYLLN